jgi:hypothetical protein
MRLVSFSVLKPFVKEPCGQPHSFMSVAVVEFQNVPDFLTLTVKDSFTDPSAPMTILLVRRRMSYTQPGDSVPLFGTAGDSAFTL